MRDFSFASRRTTAHVAGAFVRLISEDKDEYGRNKYRIHRIVRAYSTMRKAMITLTRIRGRAEPEQAV